MMFFFSKFPVAKDEEDARLLWLYRSTRCWRPLSCWICSAKPAKAAAVAVARVPARRRTGGWVWLRWLDNFFGSVKTKYDLMISDNTRYLYTCIQNEMTISERYLKDFTKFPKVEIHSTLSAEIALRTSWAHLAAQKTEPQKLRPVPLHSEVRHCPHFYWAPEHGQAVVWCFLCLMQFLNF